MHHITCHHLALSLVSDSLRLLSLGTRWSAKERSTRCSDAPRRIRWAAASWPSRHWQPTHATTINSGHDLYITRQYQQDRAHSPRPSSLCPCLRCLLLLGCCYFDYFYYYYCVCYYVYCNCCCQLVLLLLVLLATLWVTFHPPSLVPLNTPKHTHWPDVTNYK